MKIHKCNTKFLPLFVVIVLMASPRSALAIAPAEATYSASLPYIINTWRVGDGLPINRITDILQRKNGYIWLATPNGAARFDGIDFQIFDTSSTTALPDNQISALFEDRSGTLYLGHDSGRITIRKGGEFILLESPDDWGSTPVAGFEEQENGDILVTNKQGECAVIRSGLVLAPLPCELPDRAPSQIEGWVVRNDRVVKIADGAVTRDMGPTSWYIKDQRVQFLERANGDVVAGTFYDGIIIMHQDGSRTHIRNVEGLASSTALCLMEDAEETLWVGTPVGLQSIRFIYPSFTRRYLAPPFRVLRSVCPRSDGGVWLGTDKGMIFSYCDNKLQAISAFKYSEKEIRVLLEDSSGMSLWANDDDGFLLHFDKTSGVKTPILPVAGETDAIVALCETSDGTLWAGGKKGLWEKNANDWKLRFGEADGISDVGNLVSPENGTLWIGMKDGRVARLRHGKLQFTGPDDGLPDTPISILFADNSEDVLWIGTRGGGLFLLKDGKVLKVPFNQNFITGILKDCQGRLWVMGETGLSGFICNTANIVDRGELSRDEAILLDSESGIGIGTDITQETSSICKTSDGKFWLISDRQVVSLVPAEIHPSTTPVPLLITDAMVNDTHLSLEGKSSITLEPGVQYMDIKYAALSYRSAQRIRFRCRMIGLSDEWSDLGSRRVVSYQQLPPGEYRFELVASNRDGFWNNEPMVIYVNVRPHFWETWWFSVLIYLVGGGLIVLVSMDVAERLNRRKLILAEKSKAVEQERTRIAMDLHDEIGSELTRMQLLCHRISTSILKNRNTQTSTNLREMQDVVSKLVLALDEIVWVARPMNDNVSKLAGYLSQYGATFLNGADIIYDVDIPIEFPDTFISGPVRHNLFLAFKEALNNIVKHADATRVRFAVSIDSGSLQLILADNGKGIESQKNEHFKRGLENMHRRMKLSGGNFSIESNENGGTTVILELSLNESIL